MQVDHSYRSDKISRTFFCEWGNFSNSVYTFYRNTLTDAMEALGILTDNFLKTNKDITTTTTSLTTLNNTIKDLVEYAKGQKLNVDMLIQEDIVGAYKTIVANEKRFVAPLSNLNR